MHLKHCSHIPVSNLSVTTLLHPISSNREQNILQEPQQHTTQKVRCYQESGMSPIVQKNPTFTFFLPGTNGVLSQLTCCSPSGQLSRGCCRFYFLSVVLYQTSYRKIAVPDYQRFRCSSGLEPDVIFLFQSEPLVGLQGELFSHRHVPTLFSFIRLQTGSRYKTWRNYYKNDI